MTWIILYINSMYYYFYKSVLRYKFLILDSYQADIYIYVSKRSRIHRFFRCHKSPRATSLGNNGLVLSRRKFESNASHFSSHTEVSF